MVGGSRVNGSAIQRMSGILIGFSLVFLGSSAPLARQESAVEYGALGTAENTSYLSREVLAKVSPQLLQQLLQAEFESTASRQSSVSPITYVVHLGQRPSLDLASSTGDRQKNRRVVVGQLQNAAQASQVSVLAYLQEQLQRGRIRRFKPYWIFDGVVVDGDLQTAMWLASRPEVASIRPNRIHYLVDDTPRPPSLLLTSDTEPNIVQIGADVTWEQLKITGQGVVVANMDTGVDWTHVALQRKYRGYHPTAPSHDYNWFDATGLYPDAPGPTQGHITGGSDHGTHTMGVMVGSEADGSNAIGVAPGAQWVAVKIFTNTYPAYTTDEWIHDGFQWCLAPTDLDGRNPDPGRAPDIVCNSWGDPNGLDQEFQDDLSAWRAARVFSTWAAGNWGPGSATVGSPASYPNAYAIGAVNGQDVIASFSSRGPSIWGEMKPQVVAPGVGIRSSIAGSAYEGGWRGTSMATPHVAGLAALLWDATDHTMSIHAMEQLICMTAVDLGATGPDNLYGCGRIDAYQAVGTVVLGGTLQGRVTDLSTALPLEGAAITIHPPGGGSQIPVFAGEQGAYQRAVAEGIYAVRATRAGYQGTMIPDVEVLSTTITYLDLSLKPGTFFPFLGKRASLPP